jgi:monolysocardiolipin acyltransferase
MSGPRRLPPPPSTTSAAEDAAGTFGARHVTPEKPPSPLAAAAMRIRESVVTGLLGLVSLTITHVLNDTRVHGGEHFMSAYEGRAPGQGLVTVSNHVTAVDDPGATAPLVPISWLGTPSRVRWTLCATDRCFKHAAIGGLLRGGRVLPVDRGGGVYQPLMDDVVRKLDAGEWWV